MKYTNKLLLPEALFRAISNDPYSKGDSDFSVTELLKPPRAKALEIKHAEELVEDVSTRIWSLLGQTTHAILERGAAPGDLIEQRFSSIFLGKTLSGQIDLLSSDGTLYDYKVVKTYPFTVKGGSGQKPEWIAQLNMQLELLRLNGKDAKSLKIVGILRDYDKRCLDTGNHKYFMAGYPKSEIALIDIPLWDRDKTKKFINDRIQAHLNARLELPQCTPAETWGGNLCKGYCQVSRFCEQYQGALKTGRMTSDDVEETLAKATAAMNLRKSLENLKQEG